MLRLNMLKHAGSCIFRQKVGGPAPDRGAEVQGPAAGPVEPVHPRRHGCPISGGVPRHAAALRPAAALGARAQQPGASLLR